ncbi:peptide deformylase [Phycisphaeraceae bacterium D3-23]
MVDPATLVIVHYPEPVLREVAKPVPEVNDHVRAVVAKMIELMHAAPGVGLAAPQVGLPWRLFVANPEGEEGGPAQDRVYINPEIVATTGGNVARDEGCLSLPQVTVEVVRPEQATIRALGLDGQPFEDSADDLLARIWLHEYDHLDGVLIIDKMSTIDRMANKRALRALEGA